MALSIVGGVHSQSFFPDQDPYPGYNHHMKPDPSLGIPWGGKKFAHTRGVNDLPDHWNNATQRYFPPIFNQGSYGSCGVSSHVGYMMTSEMNAWQNTDASLLENQLTPMFEYPFTYHGPGKDEMALYVGFPTADIYGGRYESGIYGGSESDKGDWGWVQGYSTFYNAMCHRITHAATFPESTETESGRVALKRWLFNHNGDPSFGGRGGVACIGVGIGSSVRASVPASEINNANGLTGKEYMKHWNLGWADHAMTIVGYDDRIQFDLDGNGIVGEEKNSLGWNENGAWIIANTWGDWANLGLVYCPYATGGGVSAEVETPAGRKAYRCTGYFAPYVYFYDGGYRPLRTMKVTMQYDHRSEISVVAGVAEDTTATKPEKTFQFSYINNTGDGTGADPATPLLGKWADGVVHEEPMEFGIDLTSITKDYDNSKPLKYFLIVNSKPSAIGNGKIISASVIDYQFDENGVETPFSGHDVQIMNHGGSTVISTVVNGESFACPINVVQEGDKIHWQSPSNGHCQPVKYFVYCNGAKQGETTALSYDAGSTTGSWTVKAVYMLNGKEYLSSASRMAVRSNPVPAEELFDTHALSFTDGCFYVPDIAQNAHRAFTLEFWRKFKKSPSTYWGDLCFGNTWSGKWICISDNSGAITSGWASDGTSQISAPSGTQIEDTWQHLAFVIDGNKQTIYVNGKELASGVSTSYSGLPSYTDGKLVFGEVTPGSTDYTLNGSIDELRLWGCARTSKEIADNYRSPIANPSLQPDLEAYFKMDTYRKDGKSYIKDWAHGHDAVLVSNYTPEALKTSETIREGMSTLYAKIEAPDKTIADEPVTLYARSTVDAVSYHWQIEGESSFSSELSSPTLTFPKAGDYKVILTVTGSTGAVANASATVHVEEIIPTADFVVSSNEVEGNNRISFISLNKAPSCSYEWSMPGAEVEMAQTANASAVWTSAGEKKVTLTVTDSHGGKHTSTQRITVKSGSPVAVWSVSPAIVRKDELVQLTDQSSFSPDYGLWSLVSDNGYLFGRNLNDEIRAITPGVYDVFHAAGNSKGVSIAQGKHSFTIVNADSGNGLCFTGANQSLTAVLSSAISSEFSIDFWLNPSSFSSSCLGLALSGKTGDVVMHSDGGGNMIVFSGGKEMQSDKFFIFREWHHYAIISKNGTICLYRDGALHGTLSTGIDHLAEYSNTLTLGGDIPIDGIIDEFRIWGTALTQDKIQAISTHPLENVAEERSQDKLMAYFSFNQTSGNATDVSGNNVTGRISGIAKRSPYTSSLGVFSLSFDPIQNEKIDGTQLPKNVFHTENVSDYNSDQGFLGEKAIDGSNGTYWQTKPGVGYPHSIILKRDGNDVIRSIQFYWPNTTGRASSVSVEQSDDEENWEMVDVNHPLFDSERRNVVLLHPVTKSYIRITFSKDNNINNYPLQINEMKFYAGDHATGIGIPQVGHNQNTKIYDVQGRSVTKPIVPNVYIVHGKKVIKKD